MVDVMAEIQIQRDSDDLVLRARTEADALGQLYDLYYARIFKFCVHRLFNKDIAEDVTSNIFLDIAKQIRGFPGQTESDFANWLYAIAINHTNAYIRKTSRRQELFAEAAGTMRVTATDCSEDVQKPGWPKLYTAILKLKPEHQTIITLRFFENLEFEEIGKIINAKAGTVRVKLHRILKKLRDHLQKGADRGA